MIKTAELKLAVHCEDCEELNVSGTGVKSAVPLRDLKNDDRYMLEFTVSQTPDGNKEIILENLYDSTGSDKLDSLCASTRHRLGTLVRRLRDGGICGNLSQCPEAIKSLD